MSDEERDLIDSGAQDFIKRCSEMISQTRKLTNHFNTDVPNDNGCGQEEVKIQQRKEHRGMIIGFLQIYLKGDELFIFYFKCIIYFNLQMSVRCIVSRKL